MQTTRSSSTRLYPELLGASWDNLGDAVRQLHGGANTVRATGTFRIRHGGNRLARLLGRLAGLPPAGEAVDILLVIIPRGYGEEWRRTFARQPLVSFQWKRSDGLLAEALGSLEIRFRLEAKGGSLVYHPEGAAVRLGFLRIPLPRCCAPRISAWEKPLDDRDRLQVSVEVRLPVLGLLLAYEGTVTRAEGQE